MEDLFLSPDVYVCAVSDNAVFLDLKSQKYLALACSESPALLRSLTSAQSHDRVLNPIDVRTDPNLQETVEALLSRGIITRSPPHDATASRTDYLSTAPSNSFVCSPPILRDALSPRAFVRLLGSFARVKLRMRLLGFRSVIRSLQAKRSSMSIPMSAIETERAKRLVRAFCRLRALVYTAHEQCLTDSLILCDFLRHYGLAAELVIAVHPMPFSAHAWVQIGDYVVDDSVETVRRFHPILAA
jgi:Transglutaminase-like superfamily